MTKKEQDLLSRHFSSNQWAKARRLLLKNLKRDPLDHWLWTRLSTTYYEEKKYEEALRTVRKARRLAPDCPLALWDLAGCLDSLRKKKEAIEYWKKLLRMDVKVLAFGECGEGLRWAKSLLNDCRYRIAKSSVDMGKRNEALKWMRRHLSERKSGLPSIYTLREVKKTQLGIVKLSDKKSSD